MIRARLGPILGVLLIAEVIVFILVGNWIGFGWTILLALITSAIGLWLFGREGVRALRAMGAASRSGKAPATAAVDAGLVALGGLLVFIPGFVTDVAGLMCLIPVTRPWVRRLILGRVARTMGPARVRSRRVDGLTSPRGSKAPEVIEGEIVP
ncbi:MAG: FxsA family protein [Actinomycetota bacterium]|nr:FxsA family protein [Actinomycetota bacterium]